MCCFGKRDAKTMKITDPQEQEILNFEKDFGRLKGLRKSTCITRFRSAFHSLLTTIFSLS
jgi:hypothetical protein